MSEERLTFVEFLHNLNAAAGPDRQPLVDRFMNLLGAAPLIEKDHFVHFLYRGDARSVTIPCDANEWDPAEFAMRRIEETNLWYATYRFEPDARLDYKFVVNDADWILDPLNPLVIQGGYGQNSELRMPKYTIPRELREHTGLPRGTIESAEFRSDVLNNSRTICVYLPAGYHESEQRYPVAVFHDGLDFLSLGAADRILDYLIACRRIEPVVGVFVPPVDRNAEYAGAQMSLFDTFVVDELLPFVDRTYRTRRVAAERATIGASNGGNIALWLGLHYPETFGKIAAMSGNVVSAVSGGYEHTPRLAIEFYFDMGTYDIRQMIPAMKNFVDLIRSKGYTFHYRRYNEGHSWGNWKGHLGRVLELFFPPPGRPDRPKQTPIRSRHPEQPQAAQH
jgi:enterochelin esterase-like enzyme